MAGKVPPPLILALREMETKSHTQFDNEIRNSEFIPSCFLSNAFDYPHRLIPAKIAFKGIAGARASTMLWCKLKTGNPILLSGASSCQGNGASSDSVQYLFAAKSSDTSSGGCSFRIIPQTCLLISLMTTSAKKPVSTGLLLHMAGHKMNQSPWPDQACSFWTCHCS